MGTARPVNTVKKISVISKITTHNDPHEVKRFNLDLGIIQFMWNNNF